MSLSQKDDISTGSSGGGEQQHEQRATQSRHGDGIERPYESALSDDDYQSLDESGVSSSSTKVRQGEPTLVKSQDCVEDRIWEHNKSELRGMMSSADALANEPNDTTPLRNCSRGAGLNETKNQVDGLTNEIFNLKLKIFYLEDKLGAPLQLPYPEDTADGKSAARPLKRQHKSLLRRFEEVEGLNKALSTQNQALRHELGSSLKRIRDLTEMIQNCKKCDSTSRDNPTSRARPDVEKVVREGHLGSDSDNDQLLQEHKWLQRDHNNLHKQYDLLEKQSPRQKRRPDSLIANIPETCAPKREGRHHVLAHEHDPEIEALLQKILADEEAQQIVMKGLRAHQSQLQFEIETEKANVLQPEAEKALQNERIQELESNETSLQHTLRQEQVINEKLMTEQDSQKQHMDDLLTFISSLGYRLEGTQDELETEKRTWKERQIMLTGLQSELKVVIGKFHINNSRTEPKQL